MEIPIYQIAVLDRQRKDLGDIDALAENIRVNGQIQAGVVRQVTPADIAEGIDPKATPYVLVAGGRRYAACLLAGLETYRADDFGELSPLRQKVLELEENLNRKNLNWDEEVLLKERIHTLKSEIAAETKDKWTQTDTAKELGETVANTSRDLKLARAIREDPSLRTAPTKLSAVRVVDLREKLAEKARHAESAPTGKAMQVLTIGDSRQWLPNLPTACVDLVLTDPPYGMDYFTAGSKGPGSSVEFDDSEATTSDLLLNVVPELIRVTKPSGWMCLFMNETGYEPLKELFETCCATHFEYGEVIWQQEDNGDWIKLMPTRCVAAEDGRPCQFLRTEVPGWIWFRPNSQNPTRLPERHAKNFYERLLVVNRGQARLMLTQDECPNVLVHEAEYGGERVHSHQKPIKLATDLVRRFTQPGDLVIDPFFGSGNLLAGAASVQRKIRGCEQNPLLLEHAVTRTAVFM